MIEVVILVLLANRLEVRWSVSALSLFLLHTRNHISLFLFALTGVQEDSASCSVPVPVPGKYETKPDESHVSGSGRSKKKEVIREFITSDSPTFSIRHPSIIHRHLPLLDR